MDIRINTESFATEQEKEAFEIFKGPLLNTTKQIFLEQKCLRPNIFVGLAGEDNKIEFLLFDVAVFMQNVDTKNHLKSFMESLGKRLNPVCICMFAEAWVSIIKPEDKDKYEQGKMTPSLDPARKEAIYASFDSENICKAYNYIFGRNEEKVFFESNEDFINDTKNTEDTRYSGKFLNILKDMKKMSYN